MDQCLLLMMLLHATASLVIQLPLTRVQANRTLTDFDKLQLLRAEEEKAKEFPSNSRHSLRHWNPHRSSIPPQPIRSLRDNFYLVDLSIGTPRQVFELLIDTGSDLLWAVDSECSSAECSGLPVSRHTKKKFDAKTSSTFSNLTTDFEYTYATGKLVGYYAVEAVEFAGCRLADQVLGLATAVDTHIGQSPVDGILGLAVPGEKESPAGFLKNLLTLLSNPVFTVYLARHPTAEKTESGGFLTLGGVDNRHCGPDVTYFPLTSERHWQIEATTVAMGSFSNNSRVQVVSDTGSNSIAGPREAMIQLVNEAGAIWELEESVFSVDCNAKIPDLVFTIGGQRWNVPSGQFVVDFNFLSKRCALMLSLYEKSGIDGRPDWLIGQPFLRQYCQIYDVGQRKLGFAPLI